MNTVSPDHCNNILLCYVHMFIITNVNPESSAKMLSFNDVEGGCLYHAWTVQGGWGAVSSGTDGPGGPFIPNTNGPGGP